MAAGRTSLGLRRGGLRLSPHRALLLLSLSGCLGLGEADEARLSLHQENSQDFYQRGHYDQALHQADMALLLDEDHVGMRLMKGFCLTRLGKARASTSLLDQSVVIFEDLVAGDGEDDHRSWLGAGQAHLARAILNDAEAGRIQRRLASDFLSPDGRRQEEAALAGQRAGEQTHVTLALTRIERALAFDRQQDNAYALIDLVLILNSLGGREDEAIGHAHRAIQLLQESTHLTRNTLQKSGTLSPEGQLTLERRIRENLDKELQLRDIVLTIQFHRGAWQACLTELATLEERQLITENQVLTRATVHEQVGMYAEAASDLESYLRLRARTVNYDEVAGAIFDRIDRLRAASPVPAP